MRRIAMMMALSVALLAVSAGAVFAANQVIRCAEKPCVASGNDDLVFELIPPTRVGLLGVEAEEESQLPGC